MTKRRRWRGDFARRRPALRPEEVEALVAGRVVKRLPDGPDGPSASWRSARINPPIFQGSVLPYRGKLR